MYLFTKLMEVKQARVTEKKRKQSDTCALFSDHVLQRDRGRAVPLLSPRGHCSLRHLHGYLFPSCKCQSHAGRAELMSVAHAHMPHLPLLFQTSLFKLQPSFHSSLYCFTCFRPIKLNMDACVNIFDTDVRFSYVKSMLTRLWWKSRTSGLHTGSSCCAWHRAGMTVCPNLSVTCRKYDIDVTRY